MLLRGEVARKSNRFGQPSTSPSIARDCSSSRIRSLTSLVSFPESFPDRI